MIFYWIYNLAGLTFILADSNFLEHCSEKSFGISTWDCFFKSKNDRINCLDIDEKTIMLKVKNLDDQRSITFFEDNCNIIRLKVETNQIPPNSLLRNLKSLKLLIIQSSQNSFKEIFTGTLDNLLFNLNNLEIIRIEGFKLKRWDKNIFQSCLKVKNIDLKSLEITSIDFYSFSNCKVLQILSIKFNGIPKLMTSSFSGILELTELILSSNVIVEIVTNGNGWENVKKLKKLDLSKNKIEKLTPRLFFGLSKLIELNLMDNGLQTISTNAFSDLINLKTLNLKENPKLLSFDFSVLSPLKKTLTTFFIDKENIHCIYNKELLVDFLHEIKIAIQSIRKCTDETEEDKYTKVTNASTERLLGYTMSIYNGKQMTLILTVTVLIVVLIFVLIFFIIYYVTSRLKIKKYKSSLSNSGRYSRADTLSHYIMEFPGTYKTNYTESEGIYGIFKGLNTLKKSNSA